MQLLPPDILKPYVKSYTVITIDEDLTNEVFYPSGYVDFVVNISEGNATTIIDGRSKAMPQVELLGHLTLPSRLTVAKGTSVLIARIYPYASSLFFPNSIAEFTNYATDLYGVFSTEIHEFYDKLMHANTLMQKVKELDNFLIRKLAKNEKRYNQATMIAQICDHICAKGEAFDSKHLSHTYGFSERYIQKLFLDFVGIAPRSFFSVYRFNKSLGLVLSTGRPLTSIAYDCGYYDQAHFIKEFKKFTGITPFDARASLSVNGEEFQQAVNIGF